MEQTKTKKALIMSVLSVFLCIAMLIGMTFAWFTDTASTGVNKIQAGNLDVDLELWNGEKWVDATTQDLTFKTADNRDADKILWEPGCTYELPELRVVNNGNLALKYKIQITGIKGDAKLNEVIDWTISDVALGTEQNLLAGESNKFTIKGHMQETAGNDYQGKSIDGIAITVYATQLNSESDSYGPDYDKDALYSDVDIVTVTPDKLTTTGAISFNKSNTVYYFEGTFDNITINRENSTKNVSFIAKAGAKFNGDITIQYHAGSRDSALAESSSLTIKGIKTDGNLTIGSRDKNVIIEGNEAKQIKLQMHDIASNIQVLNNKMNGSTKYGFWLDPFVTDYELTMSGNTFENIQGHAIAIQGNAGGTAVTAAKTIDINGNIFKSYGLDDKEGRAAFKIWADTKYAPNDIDELNEAAKALATSIKKDNTFATNLGTNCVLANFYGKTIGFNS